LDDPPFGTSFDAGQFIEVRHSAVWLDERNEFGELGETAGQIPDSGKLSTSTRRVVEQETGKMPFLLWACVREKARIVAALLMVYALSGLMCIELVGLEYS
jgi:hypothetical protein